MFRRLSQVVALAAVAAAVVVAAGCGGSSSPPVASGGSTTTADGTGPGAVTASPGSPVRFAQCMRSHGIPNWPNPQPGGGFDKATLRGLGISVTRIRAVQDRYCAQLLQHVGPSAPESAQQQRALLADKLSFARCVRQHGIANFPDPNGRGELSTEMVQAQGIDVHSPAVLRVVQACIPASHGALTFAKVRDAIAHAGQ